MATLAYRAAFPVKGTAYLDRAMSWSDWISFLSTCFEKCCRTPVGLLVASVVVARATPYARLLLEKFLYGFKNIYRYVHCTEGLAEGSFFFPLKYQFRRGGGILHRRTLSNIRCSTSNTSFEGYFILRCGGIPGDNISNAGFENRVFQFVDRNFKPHPGSYDVYSSFISIVLCYLYSLQTHEH